MRIGNLNIAGKVVCAPLAGISTPVFRLLARRMGAAVVYSEMVSTHGLVQKNKKTEEMLFFYPEESPVGIQIFGADPEVMFRSTQIVSKRNPDLIDLNFGCPVKKVVNKNGGAAVLKDLGLTKALVEAAVAGSSVPVTVKLRSGWDEYTKVFAEAGKVCEEAGASAITLHARTRSKLFSGTADWNDIKKLKETVTIPVIGNGDVTSGEEAARMLDETGCDAVMIGRGALGNPRIFAEINHFLDQGQPAADPTIDEKTTLIMDHARLLSDYDGEQRAMLRMRRIVGWYVKGWKDAAIIRRQVTTIATLDDLKSLLVDYKNGIMEDNQHAS